MFDWMGQRRVLTSCALSGVLGVMGCSTDDSSSNSNGDGQGGTGGTTTTAGNTTTEGGAIGSTSATVSTSAGGQPPAASSDGQSVGTGGSAGAAAGGEGGAAADGGAGGAGPLPESWELLLRLSPLPDDVPADPTNRVADDPDAAELGQMLFFDPLFSGPLAVDSDLGSTGEAGRVSCASCHAGPALSDVRSDPPTVSIGAGVHSRNAPALVNSSFYQWTNWGGRFSAQWELPLAVVESGVIMNSNRLAVAHRIFDVYRAEYEAVFGTELDPEIGDNAERFPAAGKPKPAATAENPNPPDGAWEGMTADDQAIINTILVNYSKAITAYVRLLVSRNAPFDAYIAGDDSAINEPAKRGAALFVGKAGCDGCHSGPQLSDGEFHNLGVPQVGPNVPASDDGRFKDTPALLASAFNSAGAYSDDPDTGRLAGLTNPMPESTRGAFRTPSLRGVAESAPYMHSGQLATLEDVIEFYDAGGSDPVDGPLRPLNLTTQEAADLLAFLESLSGEPVAAELLEDTSR